jgi:hypothetical protein
LPHVRYRPTSKDASDGARAFRTASIYGGEMTLRVLVV